MKKYISTILAVLMVFSILAGIHAFADGENGFNTPDDAFEGNYAEFEGKDGSVTRVFDNGSISTKYKDGSTTAVDYNGNQYSEDKDGNASVRTTDGYVATEFNDGRKSVTEPDGKTTTMNVDGTFSESYRLGITLDYNADGGLTGIGITGGDERIETDENGCYKNGEISGPDGSKLKITDEGVHFVNAEGTVYDHTDTGDKKTTSIKWKDGSYCEAETNVTWNGDEKTENTDFTLTDSNGERWDSNVNKSYDSNGNIKYVNNNVVQWTGADGSKLWMDNNSKAMNFSGKDGTIMVVDSGGNLTEYKDSKNAWNVSYDENGNITSADITYSDGAKLVKNADGTTTFTLPDGTKYESDGKGNVTKDGEQIKIDGKWTKDESDSNNSEKDDASKGKSGQQGGAGVSGTKIDDMMGSWTYTEGSIREDYTFSWSGDAVTVVMTATKPDGTTSEPVTFSCNYTFDGETLVLTESRWHSDMALRLISKDSLEVTASGTCVMTRN